MFIHDYFLFKMINGCYKNIILYVFRKAAQQWHPDNFQGEAKKNAEKKFIEIAAAKEVLTNPGNKMKIEYKIIVYYYAGKFMR